MIGAIILLSWFLLVAIGCAVAESKAHTRLIAENKAIALKLTYSQHEVHRGQMTLASFLEMYDANQDQSLRGLDQILASLPKKYEEHSGMNWRAPEFFPQAVNLLRNPNPPEMTFTTLDFTPFLFHFNNRRMIGWERNGVVIMQKGDIQ